MSKIICVVLSSEDREMNEINLIEEMIDGNVAYFPDIKTMLEDDDDFSENKIFVVEVSDFRTVKNNPKFISTKEEPKKKVSKK